MQCPARTAKGSKLSHLEHSLRHLPPRIGPAPLGRWWRHPDLGGCPLVRQGDGTPLRLFDDRQQQLEELCANLEKKRADFRRLDQKCVVARTGAKMEGMQAPGCAREHETLRPKSISRYCKGSTARVGISLWVWIDNWSNAREGARVGQKPAPAPHSQTQYHMPQSASPCLPTPSHTSQSGSRYWPRSQPGPKASLRLRERVDAPPPTRKTPLVSLACARVTLGLGYACASSSSVSP